MISERQKRANRFYTERCKRCGKMFTPKGLGHHQKRKNGCGSVGQPDTAMARQVADDLQHHSPIVSRWVHSLADALDKLRAGAGSPQGPDDAAT